MSTVDVALDDSLKCFAVHWNVLNIDAKQHFEHLGFRGVDNFTKMAVLNGNKAREQARLNAIAHGDGSTWFWRGSYDWGVGRDSAIYVFDYTGYVGDDPQPYSEENTSET